MNERKNLLIVLGEWWEQRQSRPSPAAPGNPPGRLARALRWFLPNGGTLLLAAALILTQQVWAKPLASPVSAPGPSATTVNYQGRLADSGGTPLDGTYGMSFSLWDAATGGSLVWGPEGHTAVPVSEGLFSVGLGSQTSDGIPTNAWNGDRYLEITVGGETLSPRELIRSVPVAGMALTVPDGAIDAAQIKDGAVTTAKLADHAASRAHLVTDSTSHTLATDGNWHDDPALSLTRSFDAGTLLVDVAVNGIWCNDSTQVVEARLLVGGQVRQSAVVAFLTADFNESSMLLQWVQDVTAGQHSIKVQWRNAFEGNCRISSGPPECPSARSLRVVNLKH